jgi:hypothetical protein
MRFKTLLLGSAAVLATAAGAQAADLSVAEPVDYVRVCDAFGEGYWYIPGTDTCLAIGGQVRFGIKIGDGYLEDSGTNPDDGDKDWVFYTRTEVNVQARSMTDWGPLVAYITMRTDLGWDEGAGGDFYLDEGYLSLGPLTLGYTQSVFDVQGGGYTDSGLDLSDNTLNTAILSWSFNGFGLAIGIEDPTLRYGSSTSEIPTIAAALTTEFSGFEAGLSFLYSPNEYGDVDPEGDGDTIAVEAVISTEIGMWEFQLAGIWNDGVGFDNDFAAGIQDGSSFTGEGWAVAVSSRQNWQSNFYTAETFVWNDWDNATGEWGAAFTVGYSPVDNLWFVADAFTVDEADTWGFKVFARRDFGDY